MDPIITNALMSFGAGFTTAAISKAKGPGQALDDIMTLVGFNKLHEVAEKKRIERELNLQVYKESIAQKIADIPEENIQEPPLSIVGPALEASKFYIEEKSLREMFAKVISTSMDNRTSKKVHPAFVDIIKQLSPYDAGTLQKIKRENLVASSPYPVMQMFLKTEIGTKTLVPLIVLFDGDSSYIENAISINNLQRLGLLSVDMQTWSADDQSYTRYYENYIVDSLLKSDADYQLKKGSFYLNDFGDNFISICVE